VQLQRECGVEGVFAGDGNFGDGFLWRWGWEERQGAEEGVELGYAGEEVGGLGFAGLELGVEVRAFRGLRGEFGFEVGTFGSFYTELAY